jgi:hypothetical protein
MSKDKSVLDKQVVSTCHSILDLLESEGIKYIMRDEFQCIEVILKGQDELKESGKWPYIKVGRFVDPVTDADEFYVKFMISDLYIRENLSWFNAVYNQPIEKILDMTRNFLLHVKNAEQEQAKINQELKTKIKELREFCKVHNIDIKKYLTPNN